ncbi:MAG: hypothetical protein FWD86_02020, partial [Firmicutes bacterium]|nr:hypothetical protein [Bacillota bacterium]
LDIFSDYAHHPTEIKATLSTLSKCGYAKTIAIFEPHTYTRTKSFAARFAKELTAATQVILLPVFAARERFDIFNKTHAGSDQILNKFKGQKFFSACLAKNYDEAKAVLIESLWGQRTDNNTFGAEFDKFKDFGTASSCLSKNCANANEVPIDGKKKGKTDDNSFDNFNSFNHTCKGKGQDGGKIGDKIESKGQDGGGNWSKRGGNWSKDGGEIKKATAAAKTTAALKEYIKAAAAAAKTAVVFLGAGTIDDFAREFANFAKELK